MAIRHQQTRRRRPKIDPKTIKKHSQIAQKKAASLIVVGNKTKTDTGYIITGHTNSAFETYYEAMLPGTASAVTRHPKKDKTLRVLAGSGFVILVDGDNVVERRIEPGDEIVVKAGTSCRLATTANQGLELHVSQEGRYSARMEVLEEASATVEVSPQLLTPAERAERTSRDTTRHGSKVKEQQTTLSRRRGRSVQNADPTRATPEQSKSVERGVGFAVPAMNVRPTMGKFDEGSAG